MSHNVLTQDGKSAIISLAFDAPIGCDGELVTAMVAYVTEKDHRGISDSVLMVFDAPPRVDYTDYKRPDAVERIGHHTIRDYDAGTGYITANTNNETLSCGVTYGCIDHSLPRGAEKYHRANLSVLRIF